MTSSVGMHRTGNRRYAQAGTLREGACRIYVRPHVLLPDADLDGWGKPVSPRRPARRGSRSRPAPSPAPRHEMPPRGGVSLSAFLCLAGLAVFVLGILTLVNTSRMTEKAKALNGLRLQIEAGQKENDALAVQLEAAADRARICYAAARNLGMVSAEGADVVYITAPSTRAEETRVQAALPQARPGVYATLFGFLE